MVALHWRNIAFVKSSGPLHQFKMSLPAKYLNRLRRAEAERRRVARHDHL